MKKLSDTNNFNELFNSLQVYAKSSGSFFKHIKYENETNSLYRFGLFNINGHIYSICSWNFKNNIVVFEHEETHNKIKYDINNDNVIDQPFFKSSFICCRIKSIKRKLAYILRILSDKLQS